MKSDSSFDERTSHHRAALAVALALLAGLPACGDLDENDADPPSVTALAAWDASHVVAVRTYHKEPVIADVRTGKQTGTLASDKYYSDIAAIDGGEFVCLHNQSIDFFKADGTLDPTRSLSATLFLEMAVSADRSTLAYTQSISTSTNEISVGVVDLPSGTPRVPAPAAPLNLGQGLSVSRDGNLIALAEGDVSVISTHAPGTAATCVLELDARRPGGPIMTAFSPVADKLAVTKVDGGVNFFDVTQFPTCTLTASYVSPEDDEPWVAHLQYSPDGSLLAISLEWAYATQDPEALLMVGAIRLLDAGTGALVTEIPVYRWEMRSDTLGSYGPRVTDLQWSDAGDRIMVSTSNGPVQQWDVATGALLWSASL